MLSCKVSPTAPFHCGFPGQLPSSSPLEIQVTFLLETIFNTWPLWSPQRQERNDRADLTALVQMQYFIYCYDPFVETSQYGPIYTQDKQKIQLCAQKEKQLGA